ncbi:MAG TPA: electron transfer flavoprotein subunit alpha [Verrucomicrobiae bacterium]|nr:electron transfer flavoprotein subunit alpha [Verrucomicrobiae bacterium]
METVLVLMHVEADGSLAKSALEALGAAKSLGGTLVVGLIGANVQAAASAIAGCGAAKFLGVSGTVFSQARYGTDAAAAEALCRAAKATLVIAPATSRWNRVLSGVAHRLGGRSDTHVTGISAATTQGVGVTRWYYRQRMEAVLQRTQRPWFIALESGCGEAWKGSAGTAKIEAVVVTLSETATRTSVSGVKAPASDQQTIRPDAKILFVAGAGWTKKQSDGQTHTDEAGEIILKFLGLTKASLGSSKSLVDLSGEGQSVLPFMSHLNQVGQTGATPRHPKGLSTCCHGEEPHAVGWRFISERRAVNLDPNCGWARGKADVLYVADAFEVMRKVNALLGTTKT